MDMSCVKNSEMYRWMIQMIPAQSMRITAMSHTKDFIKIAGRKVNFIKINPK
jgi:hypothetical protein